MQIKKIKKTLISFLGIFLIGQSVCLASSESSLIEKCREIKGIFPNLKVSEIREAPIPDMCEVWVGTNVIYYHPKTKLIIFGEIWTVEGKSLTQEARYKMIMARASKLDLSKAIKWGTGPVKVILFTDPNCPHCKRLKKMLFTSVFEKDITAYVFLYPLSPVTRGYAETVLCAEDPVKKMLDFASGNITEADRNPSKECKERVKDRLEAMIKAGNELSISGTPFLIIEDEIIGGADLPKILQTIAEKKAKFEKFELEKSEKQNKTK